MLALGSASPHNSLFEIPEYNCDIPLLGASVVFVFNYFVITDITQNITCNTNIPYTTNTSYTSNIT